ncbi:MAG: type II secretion system F family protein [Candidatus Woesearchaeota archaeon]
MDSGDKINIIEQFGQSLVPQKFRPQLRLYLTSAGIQKRPYNFFSLMFLLTMIFTAAIYFGFNVYGLLSEYSPFIVSLFTFLFWIVVGGLIIVVVMGGIYFSLNLKIYNRIKEIEANMIDYLVVVSTNLKGGLSFEKSLWASIKPEFGILSEEMSTVSKKVMTGTDLNEALLSFAEKYDSALVNRNINILVSELETGGKITTVLDSIIDNLRKSRNIKNQMAANTLTFTIFIGAIVLVISPLLFALSYNLLIVLINVTQILGSATAGTDVMFTINEIDIDPDYFEWFSVAALAVISLFASMIISIIQKGDIKGGIKYLPFFIVTSTVLYLIFQVVLQNIFSFGF